MASTPLPDNPDLAWDLGETIDRDRAIEFVLQFETTLCVYSPTVQQLYSTYNIFFPREYDRKMVILPDPGAFHDTFHNVEPEAITPTGLYIIPGELVGKSELFLANVQKDRTLGQRRIPFEAGMQTIAKSRPDDDPFLPVLAKGDLRHFEESWPVLHLHRINLPALPEHSDLDRTNIRNVVFEKLESLFINQRNN